MMDLVMFELGSRLRSTYRYFERTALLNQLCHNVGRDSDVSAR